MLDIFDRFAINVDAEVNGVWKDFYGARVLIARSDNRNFSLAVTKAYESNIEALSKKDDAADALAEKLLVEVMADTLVLGWEGIAYKGKEMKYSRANAIKLLSQPELRDFRADLMALAQDVENFKLRQEAEEVKN